MTAVWLKNYVYERTRWNPTLVTFMISAFWHGFYPIYYVMFFKMFLLTMAGRVVFKNKHIFSFIPSQYRSIIGQ